MAPAAVVGLEVALTCLASRAVNAAACLHERIGAA
jgi:hypothetical protein